MYVRRRGGGRGGREIRSGGEAETYICMLELTKARRRIYTKKENEEEKSLK